MGEPDALQLVESHLDRALSNFRGSRDYYRRGSLLQVGATGALSAITTLLIGLNEIYEKSYLVAISLVTAGLATVAASLGSWLGPRRLWLSTNKAVVGLFALRDRIEYDKALYDNDPGLDRINEYHRNLLDVIAQANARWDKARQIDEP